MSSSQGPGWWKASDGLWYPPEDSSPSSASSPPAFVSSPGAQPASATAALGGLGVGQSAIGQQTFGAIGGKGFVGKLFDASFSEFITPSLIKVLWWLLLIGQTLVAIVFLITGLANGGTGAILSLLFVPLVWMVYILITRMFLEAFIVLFKIEQNTR